MPKRLFVQEAASLPKVKSADGIYSVVLISEGEGSSGRYSAELIQKSAHVFEGRGSYLNHPIDPAKPHLRPVEGITGRISNVRVGEDAGKAALLADYTPDKWHAEWVAEYADLIALSIYCGAEGEVMEDGRLDVHELDAEDPYRSVDLVSAGGRGGRFKRAEESLRAIESSLGKPESNKPTAEASAEEKETNMEKVLEAIEALAESLKPVVAFVNESAATKAGEAQTKVDAEALDTARAEGTKAAAESFKAIDDAKLPAEIAEDFRSQVLEGKDITNAIAIATTVAEAATKAAEDDAAANGFVISESAAGGSPKQITDWSY